MASSSSQPALNGAYSVTPSTTSYTPQTEGTQAQSTFSTAASVPTTTTTTTTAGPSQSTQPTQSRQQLEDARKDRTLAEFMLILDEYEPLIPNEVTDYYLQRVGFECEDPRLKRLLSLAAQKFVSDIAADAYQHARIRTNASGGRVRANQPLTGPGSAKDKTRTTLTMDDLGAALAEYGINARKPEYYI